MLRSRGCAQGFIKGRERQLLTERELQVYRVVKGQSISIRKLHRRFPYMSVGLCVHKQVPFL